MITFLGFRNLVFPSVIDIGLVLGLLLIAVALWTRLPGQKPAPAVIIAILVLALAVPGRDVPHLRLQPARPPWPRSSMLSACGFLVAGGLCITNGSRSLLAAGAVLIGIPHMIYPLREIYLASDPIFLVIGPAICAGFALVVLGLLPSSGPAAKA